MRRKRVHIAGAVAVLVAASVVATTALAGGEREVRTRLTGFQEVPAISTDAGGKFRAKVRTSSHEIRYELSYANLTGAVQQAHIHIGQRSVNGGISVFLCSNLGNGPAGTQTCPAAPATIERHDPAGRRDRPARPGDRPDGVRRAGGRDPRGRRVRQRPQRDVPGRRDPGSAGRLSEIGKARRSRPGARRRRSRPGRSRRRRAPARRARAASR